MYRLHKPSAKPAYIINGEHIYLGRYGSPESREKYAGSSPSGWNLGQRRLASGGDASRNGHPAISINEMLLAYWQFAETYYCKDGEPTKELECMKEAIWPLRQLYGLTTGRRLRPAVPEGRSPAHDWRAGALPQRGQSPHRTHQAGLQVGRRRRTGAAVHLPRAAGTWLDSGSAAPKLAKRNRSSRWTTSTSTPRCPS